MILIRPTQDLIYDLKIKDSNNNIVNINDLNSIKINVYTLGDTVLTYDKAQLINSQLLIPSQDLIKLEPGQIHVEVHYNYINADFPDATADYVQRYDLNKIIPNSPDIEETQKEYYYTKEQVNEIFSKTVNSDVLENYALKTDIPDLDDYALKSELPTDYVTNSQLNGYALKSELPTDYLTEDDLTPIKNMITEAQNKLAIL